MRFLLAWISHGIGRKLVVERTTRGYYVAIGGVHVYGALLGATIAKAAFELSKEPTSKDGAK